MLPAVILFFCLFGSFVVFVRAFASYPRDEAKAIELLLCAAALSALWVWFYWLVH